MCIKLEINQGCTTMHGQPIINIPPVLSNPKFEYRVCNSPPLASVLSQTKSIACPHILFLRNAFGYYPPIYVQIFEVVFCLQVDMTWVSYLFILEKKVSHNFTCRSMYSEIHISMSVYPIMIHLTFINPCIVIQLV